MENSFDAKKILILYHSGAGSTRTIAEIYHQLLERHNIRMLSITDNIHSDDMMDSDFLIFAFPTYHCAPSVSMISFIERMPFFRRPIKAFVFTTYGLYSGNAIRIFAKLAKKKNIVTVSYSDYRAPATDGTLLFPPFKFMYTYENGIQKRIRYDIEQIEKLVYQDHSPEHIPSFKLYTLLNLPNKYLGKWYKPTIRIVEVHCIKCNKCINHCPHACWSSADNGLPVFNRTNCESCYRCIHHCPKEALILSRSTIKKKKLTPDFYRQLKEVILHKDKI